MPSRVDVPGVQRGGAAGRSKVGYTRLTDPLVPPEQRAGGEQQPLSISFSTSSTHHQRNGNSTTHTSDQSEEETEFDLSEFARCLSNRSNRVALADGDDGCDASELLLPSGARGAGSSAAGRRLGQVKMLYYEKEILPEETLQSISLHYRCSVSELKRVNKLIQDVDFYALRRIKIPVRPHSTLSELIKPDATEHSDWSTVRTPVANGEVASSVASHSTSDSSGGSGSSLQPIDAARSSSSCADGQIVRTVSIGELCKRDPRHSKSCSPNSFLRDMDSDLQRIRDKNSSLKESLEEVTSSLTEPRFHPLFRSMDLPGSDIRRRHDGASWGVTWIGAIILVLIICLLVPLIYFWYIEFHGNHGTTTPTPQYTHATQPT